MNDGRILKDIYNGTIESAERIFGERIDALEFERCKSEFRIALFATIYKSAGLYRDDFADAVTGYKEQEEDHE